MITNKTQTQKDIDQIEKLADNTIRALKAAVSSLNNSFDYFWNLPEERLVNVLNSLIESEALQSVFNRPAETAQHFNSILQSNGVFDVRCKTVVPKVFTIGESGVTIVKPIIEEPMVEYISTDQPIIEEPVVEYIPTDLE
jgi:hypothetical protein